jgi:hypothetical protein
MQINLKNTPEQVELIKAMGSKNESVSREALEAFAAFLGPVIKEVLETAGTVSRIYTDVPFEEDSDPSIPLDLFYNEGAGYVPVWSQHVNGGLPTSQVEGIKELKFGTYTLNSAVSWSKKYARKHRLDVISKSIERMVQEVLVKQERNGWAVILKALAEAQTTTINGGVLKHGVAAGTANTVLLQDFNNLLVRIRRINESFTGNTPVQPFSNGITDMYVSPEVKSFIRAFSYNPMRTDSGVVNTNSQAIPEDIRAEAFRAGGMSSIFGINIIDMIEFGNGQKYNTLFNQFAAGASSQFPGSNSTNWQASDEICVGVDATRKTILRPVKTDADTGSSFNVLPDRQFDVYGDRADNKQGVYGGLEEGRLVVDPRVLIGLAV